MRGGNRGGEGGILRLCGWILVHLAMQHRAGSVMLANGTSAPKLYHKTLFVAWVGHVALSPSLQSQEVILHIAHTSQRQRGFKILSSFSLNHQLAGQRLRTVPVSRPQAHYLYAGLEGEGLGDIATLGTH